MNKNREIVEALGGCWHEWVENKGHQACNDPIMCNKCWKYPNETDKNPDFTTDAGKVQLIREMSKRADWYLLVHEIGKCNSGHFYSDYVEIDYILDTTGKLRDRVIKWLREEAI